MDNSPVDLDSSIPAQLRERYSNFEYVGQGGMGRIVSAIDTVLDKRVAIKILPPTVVSGTAVARFHLEAKAVSKLNHPNVVQVLDFGFASTGEPYLVMEYVRGQTLESLIEERKVLPLRLAIGLAIQICSALQHAHGNGIVHRDLKPGNIMLDEEQKVKVLDFGLAKMIEQSNVDWRVTKPGSAIGSPLFMSPEQLRGEEVDVRTDVYSLALVIFQMASGAIPFQRENLMAILRGRLEQAPPVLPVVTGNPVLGEALSALIVKALQVDREERTASMSDLKQQLVALGDISDPQKEPPVEEPNWYRNRIFTKQNLIVAGILAAIASVGGLFTLVPTMLDKPSRVVIPNSELGNDTLPTEKPSDEVLPGFTLRKETYGEHTWIANSRATDADLARLKTRQVEVLWLHSNKHFTVEGIKTISTFPLKRLNLRETRLGDEIIPYINKMKTLNHLDLRTTRISDAGIQQLEPSKALLELNLCDLKSISDSCLPHIVKSFPNLGSLGLSNTRVTGKALRLLKPLNLHGLSVSVLNLTDQDMDTVAMLKPQRIELESNLITDEGLDKLLKIPVIVSLSVEFCSNVTNKKVDEFKRKYPGIELRQPFPNEAIENTMEFFEDPKTAGPKKAE